MLALFGGLSDRFVAAYAEVAPLADGWRRRQPLHQLHPLLVHALLFGGGYGPRAVAVARGPVVNVRWLRGPGPPKSPPVRRRTPDVSSAGR